MKKNNLSKTELLIQKRISEEKKDLMEANTLSIIGLFLIGFFIYRIYSYKPYLLNQHFFIWIGEVILVCFTLSCFLNMFTCVDGVKEKIVNILYFTFLISTYVLVASIFLICI